MEVTLVSFYNSRYFAQEQRKQKHQGTDTIVFVVNTLW